MHRPSLTALVALGVLVLAWKQPLALQQPTFRTGIDVIQLDVSVLDKNRQPIRGLTVADFTVIENGKPQRIVGLSEVDAVENDPVPTAWMRHVPREVAFNDLSEEIADGRLFAIVLDDRNLPFDVEISIAARSVARYVVDQLGPSDIAAVVFPNDAGKTQDFTSDRDKLLAAIDRFETHEFLWTEATPTGAGPIAGDIRQSSPALMRSQCLRSQPTVPALDTVVSRLATVPNRRKALVLVSVGVPIPLGGSRGCPQVLADEMRDVFRKAQQANVNIYGVDPAGYHGYEEFLLEDWVKRGRGRDIGLQEAARRAAKFRHDFLEITADYTGGRAVVDTAPIESSIDRIFAEDNSYYLIGYQTSNGSPDGKFRKVEVKVNRPGATARTKSGYWAPNREGETTREGAPSTLDLGFSGMMSPQGLPLRAVAVPVARAGQDSASREAEIAVVLTARLPSVSGSVKETATVIRNVYDEASRPGPPVREIVNLNVPSRSGGDPRYDLFSRLALAPGRYQIRYNVRSAVLDKSGSVFADLEVPDFSRSPLALSPISLGTEPAEGVARTDVLAAILPIVPTTSREFAPGDRITSFLRLFQGGKQPVAPATVAAQILDIRDSPVFEKADVIGAAAFEANRAADFGFALPLERLSRGLHLLSITAKLPAGSTARRDLVFRVR